MKDKLIILLYFILIFNIKESFSQKSGIYKLKNETYNNINKDLEYSIVFYPLNKYEIRINYWCLIDVVEERIPSFGDYIIKDDTIIMKDKINEYFIKMKYENNELHFVQSFYWMKNLIFEYWHKFERKDSISYYYNNDHHEKFVKERDNYNNKNKDIYDFKIGKYLSNWKSWVAEINFSSDSTYKLISKNLILSNGTWKRNKNIIILWDNSLNYNFYVFINKDFSLNCDYLPSIGEGEIFCFSK